MGSLFLDSHLWFLNRCKGSLFSIASAEPEWIGKLPGTPLYLHLATLIQESHQKVGVVFLMLSPHSQTPRVE